MRTRHSAAYASLLLAAASPLATSLACRSATEPAERIYTLDVSAARVPCTGSIPQQCLQVRERTDAPYTLFYETISGFTYEPGYHYLLRVGERSVVDPPPDASSKTYRLISILSRTAATP